MVHICDVYLGPEYVLADIGLVHMCIGHQIEPTWYYTFYLCYALLGRHVNDLIRCCRYIRAIGSVIYVING